MTEYDKDKFISALRDCIKCTKMVITGSNKIVDLKDINNIFDIEIKMKFPISHKWNADAKYDGCCIKFKSTDIKKLEIGPYETFEDAWLNGAKEEKHVDIVQRLENGKHTYYWRPCFVSFECYFKLNEPMSYNELKYKLINDTRYSQYMSKGFSNESFFSSSIGKFFSENYK